MNAGNIVGHCLQNCAVLSSRFGKLCPSTEIDWWLLARYLYHTLIYDLYMISVNSETFEGMFVKILNANGRNFYLGDISPSQK